MHVGLCISQDIHRHFDIELAYFFLRENIGAPNGSDADITEVRAIRSCFGQAHQDDCILLIQQGFQKTMEWWALWFVLSDLPWPRDQKRMYICLGTHRN